MPLMTAAITQYGDTPTAVPQLIAEPRYAVRITFGAGQQVWLVSHSDMAGQLPAGASILSAKLLDEPLPSINKNAGFDSGKSTITSPTYKFADIDDSLTALFANKNVNGFGSFNRLIEEWEVDKGVSLVAPAGSSHELIEPKFTGIIQDHNKPYNKVEIETADINRGLDEEIFDPLAWNLNSTIDAEQDTIPTTLSPLEILNYQATFAHASWYLAGPGATIGYARIEATGEIFSYTAFEDVNGIATFTGVTRGVLRTTASSVEVEENTEKSKRQKIAEWIVIDEPATDLVHALITGTTEDGRALPAHWTAGKGSRWVKSTSFAQHSTSFRLQFQNYGKVKCRDFYEKEILLFMGAVLTTNGYGELVWTPRARPIDSDAGAIVLDQSNCVDGNDLVLRHIKTGIYSSFKINFDYDAISKQYLSPYTWRDIESELHNGIEPGKRVKEFNSKGMHAGIHTGAQIQKLVSTFGDDYFYEKQSLTIESFINGIELGTLVTVDFPNVRDDATGAANDAPLHRTMLVIASSENRATRTTTYTLSGSLYVQSNRQASQNLHNIPVEEYKRGKINIATLPGISIANGIATGNITLQMGKHYYYVDDDNPGTGLEFADTLNVTVTGTGPMLGIWVFGPFDCKTTIDLTAKSGHASGVGETQNSRATNGVSGYVLTSRSTGAVDVESLYTSFLSSNEDVYARNGFVVVRGKSANVTRGLNARAPDPVLNLNNGLLGGLPSDMGGTSGSGGPMSTYYDADRKPTSAGGPTNEVPTTQYLEGSRGGIGGGSLLAVTWGFSITGNGVVILDGGDAGIPNSYDYNNKRLFGGIGGPGGPGSILSVIDGTHPAANFTETNVLARFGNAHVDGIRLFRRGQKVYDDGVYKASLLANNRDNHVESVTRNAYTPDVENVQQRSDNVLDLFFANQRDGRVRIFVQDVDPSNASLGDMRITQADLDANEPDVDFRILTATGWRDFVRGVDDFEYVYDALIAGKRQYGSLEIIASATRPQGEPDGTIWYNTVTKTEWILYENADDILIRENQVPQGEDLIDDLHFTRSLAGERPWVFTRDKDLPPINIKKPGTATGDTSGGNNGGNSQTGISLTDQGRTVSGNAYQDDGGGVIVDGRTGTVTLEDGTQQGITASGGDGSFSTTFPSTHDNNLGKQASVYISNAGSGTQAQLNFTYEL